MGNGFGRFLGMIITQLTVFMVLLIHAESLVGLSTFEDAMLMHMVLLVSTVSGIFVGISIGEDD